MYVCLFVNVLYKCVCVYPCACLYVWVKLSLHNEAVHATHDIYTVYSREHNLHALHVQA